MKNHKNTQRKPGDEPSIENYPVLDEWLTKINAVCLWRADTKSSLRSVEAWSARGAMFIVVMYEQRRGFDVFTAPNTNDIGETFADAEQRLGIADPEQVEATQGLPLNPPAMAYQTRAALVERGATFTAEGKGEIISHVFPRNHGLPPMVFWFWTYENRAWCAGPYNTRGDALDALKRFEALALGPQLRTWSV